MTDSDKSGMLLNDGSKIAVIGGGPAGSLFAYFALDFADRLGITLHIDLYEPKDFNCAGPAGCNNCGGIVSESLVQMLSAEGIVFPNNVIRRGIESYKMYLETGTTHIETPLHEQRIAAVYRGFGPKGATDHELSSFDAHLLNLSEQKGAKIITERVNGILREDNGIIIKTKQGREEKYDLVAGAAGLNSTTLKLFESLSEKYSPPETTKTYICEFYLESDLINEYFGNSMHVFLLNQPHIKFGALIPKNHFVTLVMLGSEINQEIVRKFIQSETVKSCFPKNMDLDSVNACQCYPFINITGAKSAFGDRFVLLGDSGSSKLYKNGIGAAYITAKSAARAAVFTGISEKAFRTTYGKTCADLNLDNRVGKLIFMVTTIIQKSMILKKGLQRQVRREQKKISTKRRMSSVLWDTFTGSASYRNILLRTLHPYVLASLIWNIFAAQLTKD